MLIVGDLKIILLCLHGLVDLLLGGPRDGDGVLHGSFNVGYPGLHLLQLLIDQRNHLEMFDSKVKESSLIISQHFMALHTFMLLINHLVGNILE